MFTKSIETASGAIATCHCISNVSWDRDAKQLQIGIACYYNEEAFKNVKQPIDRKTISIESESLPSMSEIEDIVAKHFEE